MRRAMSNETLSALANCNNQHQTGDDRSDLANARDLPKGGVESLQEIKPQRAVIVELGRHLQEMGDGCAHAERRQHNHEEP
ncbi:hypothetical protein D3C79_1006380 [compost metagenome]